MNDATGMPQTAVAVGGSSDIGRAVLRALVARRLRRIVLAGRDETGLRAVADELLGLGATAVETVYCDVTDAASLPALAK
ncbi:MAG: KR domain-containing protein, partial [Acidimicrobiales bacterium]